MKQIFAILGGDARQISLAAHLAATNAEVRAFGLPAEALGEEVIYYEDWRAAIADANAVLLPLPASPDGIRVHTPLVPCCEAPRLQEVLEALPPGAFLAGGRFTPAFRALAEQLGHTPFDYCKSEAFQQANAIPTAEGAVQILMERLPRTVRGLSVAITGYGRVGRALASLLLAMGASVRVGARKADALLQAKASGCDTVRLCGDASLLSLADGCEVILNTVPHWLFGREILERIPRSTLLVDLASAPGGVDFEAAAALGHSVIWALSLPGKYAPVTAGEIIADTVLSCMEGGE